MKQIDIVLKKGDCIQVQTCGASSCPLRVARVVAVMEIPFGMKDYPYLAVHYTDGDKEYGCISKDQFKGLYFNEKD